MKAMDLKTEYMTCPKGLDIVSPRFFWKNNGGIKQTAYRVEVFSDGIIFWDSGKVFSSDNTHILYEGKSLIPKTKMDFQVTLWDENDAPGETVSSSFETGLMGENFLGKWITGSYKPKKNHRYPADYFRKKFSLDGTTSDACLYITAKGIYRVCINGKKLDDFLFAPGTTDYRKRLQYQVYDVTAFLKDGENEIAVILGDGWYRGSIGCFGKTNVFGRKTAFICQLEYKDGKAKNNVILSDETWEWSNDGPIRFDDLKDGEIIDSAAVPSFGQNARLDKGKNTFRIVSSNNVYVTKHERFSGKIIAQEENRTLIDFGQNIAGIVAFHLTAEKGQKLNVRLGEMLDSQGRFTQKNFQETKPVCEFGKLTEIFLITGNKDRIHKEMQNTPLQEIHYLCKDGENDYETMFSVFGFRYALIESDADLENLRIEAIAVYSDLEKTGDFNCSDSRLNQLFRNTCWSMKSNFLDIPTDCPTRERLGWTGDGQIFFNTASYLALTPSFYRKWLSDFMDSQQKNGKISAVVPYNGMSLIYDNTGSSAGWADAAILIPYRFYQRYGDKRILEECFEMMRSSIHFMISYCGQAKKDNNNPYSQYVYEKGVHLGEWLEPEEFKDMDNNAGAKIIRQPEVATAYLYNSLRIYREICILLKKEGEKELIEKYLSGTKKAYYYCFLKDFDYTSSRQAKLVRPLAFGIAEGEEKKKLADSLAKSVKARNGKIGTGFLSTAFLLPVLAENGYAEEAYETLFNKECPGWLYQVDAGATSIWEAWENDGHSSKNHYSFGAVSEFLFAYTLGIQVMGKNEFFIVPLPTEKLSFASGYYESIYGKIMVSWKYADDRIMLDVTVPSNCTAILQFCGNRHSLSAGQYHFEKRKELL